MPRLDFVCDLQEASSQGKTSHMVSVKAGDDDGVISCTFSPDTPSGKPVEIQILVSGMYGSIPVNEENKTLLINS